MQWHTQHRDAYGCGEGWEDEEDEEDKDATLWPTFVDKFCYYKSTGILYHMQWQSQHRVANDCGVGRVGRSEMTKNNIKNSW